MLILLLITAPLFAQERSFDEALCRKTVKAQANRMGVAFVKNDYKSFASFMHPDVVRMAGGQQKIVVETEKAIAKMLATGVKIVRVECGAPSKMVVFGKELQCTLPQTTEMRRGEQTGRSKSVLIAVSQDNGVTWYFLETAGKDLATMRASFPGISSELVYPSLK